MKLAIASTHLAAAVLSPAALVVFLPHLHGASAASSAGPSEDGVHGGIFSVRRAQESGPPHRGCKDFLKEDHTPQNLPSIGGGSAGGGEKDGVAASVAVTECSGGSAAGYPCLNVNLMSFLALSDIGDGDPGTEGNDCWGWTDSASGREFAIMGLTIGTSFVEITDPVSPVYLGILPTHTSSSSWRDIKTYDNHAFVVSEASGHGMQIFDLTQLLTVTNPPVTFSNTAYYNNNNGVGKAHNVFINEDTGVAYIVGGSTGCNGGLHMVDIATPTSPAFAGCYSSDGYTHDVQCVVYNGPDTTYTGQEICFALNEDTVTIVDVTDKSNPIQLARKTYSDSNYAHQGWLTDDHRYLFFGDELDERNRASVTKTRTFVMDVSDLDNPLAPEFFEGRTAAIDHNQYIKGDLVYQANYRAGLSILQINDAATANLEEVGYFDVYPSSDSANFNGAWSTYPFFDSGLAIISGIEQGLFVVKYEAPPTPSPTVSSAPSTSVPTPSPSTSAPTTSVPTPSPSTSGPTTSAPTPSPSTSVPTPSYVCGNGVCEDGENCNTCSADCASRTNGPSRNQYCCDGAVLPDCGSPNCDVEGGPVCGANLCSSSAECDDGDICTDDICLGSGQCSNTDKDPLPDGCGGGTGNCGGNKAPCSANGDCCSNTCNGGQCKGNRRRLTAWQE